MKPESAFSYSCTPSTTRNAGTCLLFSILCITAALASAADGPAAAPAAGGSSPPTSAIDFFTNNGINYSNRALVATSDILAAESKLFDVDPFPIHTLGILLSGSVPLNNPSSTDYLTAELLQKDGAVGNMFFSFHYRTAEWTSKSEITSDSDSKKAAVATNHPSRADKSYIVLPNKDNEDELLGYLINGWGGRMYRAITAPGSPTQYYGVGTAYMGIGADGIAQDSIGTNSGSLQIEGYVTGNYANGQTLDSLYSIKGAPNFYSTGNLALKLNVASYTIALSYGTSMTHSMRAFAKDVASISISYKGSNTATSK